MSHNISKHQLKHDEYAENMAKTMTFISKHSVEVISGLAGAIIIVVGIILISQNRVKSEREASLTLSQVHGAFFQSKDQDAKEGYQEIIKRFGSTASGKEARVFLGNLYFRQRNFTEALKSYNDCIKAGPGNPVILNAALTGIAACHEQNNDMAKAGDQYLETARRLAKDDFFAPSALLSAGRCFETAKLYDRARAAYQTVVDKYPESFKSYEAKSALSMLPPKG